MDITCPHCHQTLEGEDSLVGESVTCPGCNKTFVVPKLVVSGRTSSGIPSVHPVKKPSMLVLVSTIALSFCLGVGAVFGLSTRNDAPTKGRNGSQVKFETRFEQFGPNGPLLLVKCDRTEREHCLAESYFVFEGSDIRRFYNSLSEIKQEYAKFLDETSTKSERIKKRLHKLEHESGFFSSCVAWYMKQGDILEPYSWSTSQGAKTNRTFADTSSLGERTIELIRMEKGRMVESDYGNNMPSRSVCSMGMWARPGMGKRVFNGEEFLASENLPREYETSGDSGSSTYLFSVRFLIPKDFDELRQQIEESVPKQFL